MSCAKDMCNADKSYDYINEPLSIVVVGASGDLAKKKTFPALLDLFRHQFLPSHVSIYGYARSKMDDAALHGRLRPFLLPKGKDADPVVDDFLARVSYRHGQEYGDIKALGALVDDMEQQETQREGGANRVYYFAIPPDVFLATAAAIKEVGVSKTGWTRLIVEKPFGHDYESALQLARDLGEHFDESFLFRIDHYLGKEMVQNLLVMRFSNMIFEPIWSRENIASVQLTFKEDFGTEGRGGYFNNYGILRDVVQNHLMQVFSLIAMETPVRVAGPDYSDYVRDAKVNVVKSVAPIEIANVVLGQYVAADGKPGYLDDETVPSDSRTPTFAAVVVFVKNRRWDGVPFIFKAGKALNERKAEVRLQFRDVPGADFAFAGQVCPRNELVLRLQPSESVYLKTNVKLPGLHATPVQSELDLTYTHRFPEAYNPDAYIRLILEVLRGKQAAFVRGDELVESWRLWTPLLQRIEAGEVPLHPYPYGSRGPKAADELVARHGFTYYSEYTHSWQKSEQHDGAHGGHKL